jgi:hydrophobic/amphiphilic exporter-1 (mainly G- bacteria), HAE1 family
MNLSAIAIKRPVFTVMLMAAVLVLGLLGLVRTGTDLFPDVTFPVVMVTVPYPGASPGEVEELISKDVEDAVISLNGIDRVRSFSREGVSQTWVMFKLGTDLDDAAIEVRERVAQMRHKLPADAKEPTIGRFDVSAAPIRTYALRGEGSLSAARKFADDVIKPELEQVTGVAAVVVQGGGVREIQVDLDRAKLDALNLSPSMVAMRLRAENVNVPAGRFDEGTREINVRTVGEFPSVEAIRNVIVASAADGSSVRLRDLAQVTDGFEEQRTLARVNGSEAVTFDIVKRSGENTVAVADAADERLQSLKARFPKGFEVSLIVDQARFIRSSVTQVEEDLLFGGVMAILVILVFMLDLRSTIISGIALPTSVIGTFFFVYIFGYTLNMMTLLALSLSIGLLIDDAVVVRENIFKHLEAGKGPLQAALDGTKEISLVVLATTATVVAVFLPVAFVPGMVGQFFRQFGNTVIAAVVLSMFVAFTLDPMLSSRFSKKLGDKRDTFAGLKRPFRWFFANMEAVYKLILGWVVRRKVVVSILVVVMLGLVVVMLPLVGFDFVNPEDRGQYVVEAELPPGTSLTETARASSLAEAELRKHPQIHTVFSVIGPLGEINKAKWRVVATPKHERKEKLEELKQYARETLARILPSAKIVVADIPFVEGAATEVPIMILVQGEKYEDILPVARGIERILKATAGVKDIDVKYSPGRPELQVAIDRERAAERGLTVAPLAMALRAAMEGEEAGDLGNEVPIRVRLAATDRERPEDLASLTLPTPRGLVRLGDVARFTRGEGPQVIERENRNRQVAVWATPVGRPLGEIGDEIKPQIAALEKSAGTSVFYDGFMRLMNENNSAMLMALGLGAAFIFIILASQFESFIHPITIMVTLPLAMVGAVVALFLSGNSMAMGSLIGIILLMGLVTKNAILLIDRAIVRVRDHGDTPVQAILEAGPQRLRPILMTSAAMVLGMLPTATGTGEGSEFRAPMAIAVIGGVISSTLLSLIVVPVFYLTIENLKSLASRAWRRIFPAAPVHVPEAAE